VLRKYFVETFKLLSSGTASPFHPFLTYHTLMAGTWMDPIYFPTSVLRTFKLKVSARKERGFHPNRAHLQILSLEEEVIPKTSGRSTVLSRSTHFSIEPSRHVLLCKLVPSDGVPWLDCMSPTTSFEWKGRLFSHCILLSSKLLYGTRTECQGPANMGSFNKALSRFSRLLP
jgi:hypothetical protein